MCQHADVAIVEPHFVLSLHLVGYRSPYLLVRLFEVELHKPFRLVFLLHPALHQVVFSVQPLSHIYLPQLFVSGKSASHRLREESVVELHHLSARPPVQVFREGGVYLWVLHVQIAVSLHLRQVYKLSHVTASESVYRLLRVSHHQRGVSLSERVLDERYEVPELHLRGVLEFVYQYVPVAVPYPLVYERGVAQSHHLRYPLGYLRHVHFPVLGVEVVHQLVQPLYEPYLVEVRHKLPPRVVHHKPLRFHLLYLFIQPHKLWFKRLYPFSRGCVAASRCCLVSFKEICGILANRPKVLLRHLLEVAHHRLRSLIEHIYWDIFYQLFTLVGFLLEGILEFRVLFGIFLFQVSVFLQVPLAQFLHLLGRLLAQHLLHHILYPSFGVISFRLFHLLLAVGLHQRRELFLPFCPYKCHQLVCHLLFHLVFIQRQVEVLGKVQVVGEGLHYPVGEAVYRAYRHVAVVVQYRVIHHLRSPSHFGFRQPRRLH